MELWTEYEGRTINGVFPLTKLLRPEGRSAFFSTSNGTGVPRLIRLIESHFDDDEILTRWRRVAALDHPNLLKLKEYGKVVLDDTSLVYAVMEPVDANLGEVVSRQRLTAPEIRQLAISLVAALETLHSHGFVHEHVEPATVLAVGEVVKLRSDCIREVPEGNDGWELKRRDAHDLAVVLLQALTQKRTLEDAVSDLPLPAPFDLIVEKGMSGEWGVAEISAALKPMAASPDASPSVASLEALTSAARTPSSTEVAVPPESKRPDVLQSENRLRVPIEDGPRSPGPRIGLRVVIGLAVMLSLWAVWHFLHTRPAIQSESPRETSTQTQVVKSSAPATASAPGVPASPPQMQNKDAPGARDQWRVITYTYNHEGQAQHKSALIAQRHPELHPEVFAPDGHAPYLVTVGGAMSREEAFALATKVRGEGLPRDSYAQNYSGKDR